MGGVIMNKRIAGRVLRVAAIAAAAPVIMGAGVQAKTSVKWLALDI